MRCKWCGAEVTEDELDMDEHDAPAYCPHCEHRVIPYENEKTNAVPDFDMTLLMQRLSAHCGHDVAIVKYGIGNGCYCLECEDCNEVICDTDIYDLCAKEE